ncbi:MAG TPA: multicopper oxidase domain-containing protein [Geobacteraceae bacterium]
MKIRSRRILFIGLQASLLAALVVPALARVGIQCPFPLLTQNGLSYNQHDPIISTDPNCRNVNVSNFTQICRVDINAVTGQPSGITVRPRFLNSSSILFVNATSPNAAFRNASTLARLLRLGTPVAFPNAGFNFTNATTHIRCRSITCGDGHVMMGDRDRTGNADLIGDGDTYIFGFKDVTGVPPDQILPLGFAGAQHLAPTMLANQNEELWLTLTNAGFRERPDLVDAHTVHYHGFPNAASAFDGEPMASFGINLGSSLTYFYNNVEPGTYIYHCHVEAAEHMQMGMLGQLFINPAQDGTLINGFTTFAYNDCTTLPLLTDPMCGVTGYNILKPVEITSFDPVFHHFDNTYQKVRFDLLDDTYGMFNGRGYPDTIVRGPIINNGTPFDPAHLPSQPINAIPMQYDSVGNGTPVTVTVGQRVLIRMPSLSTVDFYTITVLGIPFQVVGEGARLLRGPAPGTPGQFGLSTIYRTNSVTLGGGEAYDILLDTTGVQPGTYFMYTANLNILSNNDEDFGGMMTEIVVTP